MLEHLHLVFAVPIMTIFFALFAMADSEIIKLLASRLAGWLAGWRCWLAGWLTNWLAGWLAGWAGLLAG